LDAYLKANQVKKRPVGDNPNNPVPPPRKASEHGSRRRNELKNEQGEWGEVPGATQNIDGLFAGRSGHHD